MERKLAGSSEAVDGVGSLCLSALHALVAWL